MSVAKKEKKGRGEKKLLEREQWAKRRLERRGKDFIPRVSRKVQRITCVNQSTDDR